MTPSPKKDRLTAQLPQDVMERVRNAVYWTPGLTIAGITTQALNQFVDQLEKERGESFPPRQGAVKTGRPVKM